MLLANNSSFKTKLLFFNPTIINLTSLSIFLNALTRLFKFFLGSKDETLNIYFSLLTTPKVLFVFKLEELYITLILSSFIFKYLLISFFEVLLTVKIFKLFFAICGIKKLYHK